MTDQNSTDTLLARTQTWLLRALAVLIAGVTVQCFVQSYRQLLDWATRHRIPLWIAPTWPASFDAFILIGEIVLFMSIVRDWPRRTRVLAWIMAVAGLVASVVAQWLYLPAGASWFDRGTAVVAPLGATLGLAAGLVLLKWLAADHRNGTAVVAEAEQITRDAAPADELQVRREIAATKAERVTKQASRLHDVAGARAAIERGKQAGRMPSAYSLGMTYLGGDPAKKRRGDERLAKQLLDEVR